MELDFDSFLSEDPQKLSTEEVWTDLRLIHESGGGWCAVYSTIYRGRRVAVKALKEEYRQSEIHGKLLKKEFEVMSMMNHPNIVSALWYDSLPDLGDSIVMEYVDGQTLADYLAEHQTLDDIQIKELLTQICTATDYLHSRQTFHCDLKPSNVMLTSVGRFVKLIDLGMSRGNGYKTLEYSGGTEGFTAPEAMKTGAIASREMDIYSIGKILKLMDRKGRFKSVSHKCTVLEPKRRPKSAMEIPQLIEQTIKRRKSRRRFSAVAVCLAAVAALGIWLFPDNRKGNVGIAHNETVEETELDTAVAEQPKAAERVVTAQPKAAERVVTAQPKAAKRVVTAQPEATPEPEIPLLGGATRVAYWDEFDTIIISRIDKVGVWHNDTIKVPIKPGEQYLDPAGVEQRRRDYMERTEWDYPPLI